jgi:hypothetical protein
MNILKRYEYGDIEESGSSKPFLVKAIAMILAVTGIAYGANIALTSSGSRTEFGQGFVTTTTCDTNGGITVIPYAGFINDTGTGKFSLDSIILEDIDAACVGEDFTIQVYSETGGALTLSETATSANGGSYQTLDLAKFYFSDSSTVQAQGMAYIDYDILHDPDTDFTSNKNSIQITFDPDRTVSFADATAIRRITIQTVKHP